MFIVPTIFSDKRILIVEDEILVALLVEDIMLDLGCTVGTYGNVADAHYALEGNAFDVALLDINLKGERSYPVAEALAIRGIPFLFMLGYGDIAMPADHPEWKVCTKPFREGDLVRMLLATLTDNG